MCCRVWLQCAVAVCCYKVFTEKVENRNKMCYRKCKEHVLLQSATEHIGHRNKMCYRKCREHKLHVSFYTQVTREFFSKIQIWSCIYIHIYIHIYIRVIYIYTYIHTHIYKSPMQNDHICILPKNSLCILQKKFTVKHSNNTRQHTGENCNTTATLYLTKTFTGHLCIVMLLCVNKAVYYVAVCQQSSVLCCCVSTQCNTISARCNTLQHTATHCNTLQHTATHRNTLQHTATHCNTPQHHFSTM